MQENERTISGISFELSPERPREDRLKLPQLCDELATACPDFFAVTSSIYDPTVFRLPRTEADHNEYDVPVAPHVSYAGATKEGIIKHLESYRGYECNWNLMINRRM